MHILISFGARYLILLLFCSPAAIIGFEQEVYDVPESAGTVNVTVRLTGTIAKTVVITLNTSDGAAICKLILCCD